jgi:hypothetical protein
MATELEKQLAAALEAVIDSGLLYGLTELHDLTRFKAVEALSEFDRQQNQEQTNVHY